MISFAMIAISTQVNADAKRDKRQAYQEICSRSYHSIIINRTSKSQIIEYTKSAIKKSPGAKGQLKSMEAKRLKETDALISKEKTKLARLVKKYADVGFNLSTVENICKKYLTEVSCQSVMQGAAFKKNPDPKTIDRATKPFIAFVNAANESKYSPRQLFDYCKGDFATYCKNKNTDHALADMGQTAKAWCDIFSGKYKRK